LRGNKFTVECDHQALKPLFQNKLRGAIYDRWLAVLQQFNFDIKYKPGAQMQVPDALSRVENAPLLDPNAEESLNENDPYFPYESEEVGKISFLNYVQFNSDDIDHGYIADTEAESDLKSVTKNLSRNDSISTPTCNIAEYDLIDVSGNNGISTLTCMIAEYDLIDVSGSNGISTLTCNIAEYDLIDVSGNNGISTLTCNIAEYDLIDVSGSNGISTLTCSIAEYDLIDVSGNNGISTLTCNIVEHDLIDLSGKTVFPLLLVIQLSMI
jgi:hypothetical protein